MGHRKKKTLKAFGLYRFFWEASVQQQSDGIHANLAALLPYGAKSPRKISQGHEFSPLTQVRLE